MVFPAVSLLWKRSTPAVYLWLPVAAAPNVRDTAPAWTATPAAFRIPYGTGRCSRSHYISYLYMAPYQLISPFLFPINLCSPAKCCYNRCHLFLYTTSLSHILFFLHYLHTLSLCPISYSTNISKTALTGASFLCLSNHQ